MKKHLFSLFLLFFAITVSAQEISRELIKMAKKGDVEAQLTLGKSYIENSQSNKAARWLYDAAKNGNKEAEKLLFSFYSKEFEKYAKEGNVDAQFHLGKYYLENKETEKAAKWFYAATKNGHKEAEQLLFSFYSKELEKYAKEGNVDAQLNLGKCYIAINQEAKAAKWFYTATKSGNKEAEQLLFSYYSKELEKYAKEGNVDAQLNLGKCYFNNEDKENAAKWFYTATKNGNKEAEQLLFSFYSKELKEYAKEGNVDAQLNLGKCYFNEGEKEDAAKWFYAATKNGNKEAEQLLFSFYSKDLERYAKEGNVDAQLNLGKCYFNNEEKEDAAKWFYTATKNGNKEAEQLLFSFYSKYLEKYAKEGNVDAQLNLGKCYFNEGETEDAAKWFYTATKNGNKEAEQLLFSFYSKSLEKYAKEGNVDAQLNLGKCYIGIEQKAKAAKWLYTATKNGNKEAEQLLFSFNSKELEKYAKEGNVDAQLNLGKCYFNDGDTENAAKWFYTATKNGNNEAEQLLFSFYSSHLVKYAKEGNINAQVNLGKCYYQNGETEKAAKWYYEATKNGNKEAEQLLFAFYSSYLEDYADEGNIEAQLNLGKRYLELNQEPKAAKWFYTATKNGNKEAEQLLFTFYSKELEKYAKEGNVDAQLNLGKCYFKNAETEKAAKWYYEATMNGNKEAEQLLFSFHSSYLVKYAKENNIDAQISLGKLYLQSAENEDAAKWFYAATKNESKEAEQLLFSFYSSYLVKYAKEGNVDAQISLGKLYLASAENEDAAKWFYAATKNESKEAEQLLFSFYSSYLVKYAKEGNVDAQISLGKLYLANAEKEDAAEWLYEATKNGSKEAEQLLFSFYSKELEKYAKEGNVDAQLNLGKCYIEEGEMDKAAKWFYTAAKNGNKEAESLLLSSYSKELEKYAKEGSVDAQLCLGKIYLENGEESKAAKWLYEATEGGNNEAKSLLFSFYSKDFEKLAQEGNVEAQLNLGKCYARNSENRKAAKWFYVAAKNGDKEAENLLYSFYSKELEEYAEEGNADAQFYTGQYYKEGLGVKGSLSKAAMWYDMATAQGHAEAKKQLGTFYSKQLFKRADIENDAEMQYRLALCYLDGIEVKANKEEAAKYFEKAMHQDHAEAEKAFFALDSKLKSDRIQTITFDNGNEWYSVKYNGYAMKNRDGEIYMKNSPYAKITLHTSYPISETSEKRAVYESYHYSIDGCKEGNLMRNAELESPSFDFTFKGDVQIDLSEAAVLTLKRGGTLQIASKNRIQLESDLVIRFTGFNKDSEYTVDLEFNNEAFDKIIVNVPLNDCIERYEVISPIIAKELGLFADFNRIVCDVKQTLGIADKDGKSAMDLVYCLYRDSYENDLMKEKQEFAHQKFYTVPATDGQECERRVLVGKNREDMVVWNQHSLKSFVKRYADAYVEFYVTDSDGKENCIQFADGSKFTGSFHLGNLKAEMPGFLPSDEINGMSNIKTIWGNDRIVDVVFVNGIHTDKNGTSTNWANGLPVNDIDETKAVANENTTEQEAEKEIYVRKEIRELLAEEGFNEADIATLLDNCEVRTGMSRRLIQRAHELGSSLKIEKEILLDGAPRDIVSITDKETGSVVFYKTIGYDLVGNVAIIEPVQ